jgi:hypothetical protein
VAFAEGRHLGHGLTQVSNGAIEQRCHARRAGNEVRERRESPVDVPEVIRHQSGRVAGALSRGDTSARIEQRIPVSPQVGVTRRLQR